MCGHLLADRLDEFTFVDTLAYLDITTFNSGNEAVHFLIYHYLDHVARELRTLSVDASLPLIANAAWLVAAGRRR